MTIIIDDFNYKGKHYDRVEFDMPQLDNIEDVPEDKITAYVIEGLENLLKEE